MSALLLRAYRLLRVDAWSRTAAGERMFLAAFFAYKKWVEDPHAAFVRRHADVLAGGHVLDVGANVGYTATLFARTISPGFRVFAFEPEPLNFARLERVIERRNLQDAITAVQTAVGDEDGTATLWQNPDHPGDHQVKPGGTLTVPIIRLDTFAETLEPIKFVKIDVQGHELAVSRGMSRLIERDPALEISFEHTGDRELIEFYRARGFNLHLIDQRGALLPFANADEVIRARGYCDVFATRMKRA